MTIRQKTKRYVAGVDGGGTKTACMIADEMGTVLAYAISEGSNHQISGFARTMENVCQSLEKACVQAGIVLENLSVIYLGMAGADSCEDFQMLNKGFAQIFGRIPFQVVNDVWIAFACEARQDWGAVSVCGTGGNLAVKNKQGKVYSVRALRYMLGNYGGGHHLAEIAMHWAFRCDEHTGPYTRLAQVLPEYCGCKNMNALAQKIYESGYQYYKSYNVPRLVFELAWQGDSVCVDILAEMGSQIGTMLGRLIQHAGMEGDALPVVLAGSQYAKDAHGLLITPLETALRAYAPLAQLRVVRCPPVVGAVLKGLESIGEKPSPDCRAMMQEWVEEQTG